MWPKSGDQTGTGTSAPREPLEGVEGSMESIQAWEGASGQCRLDQHLKSASLIRDQVAPWACTGVTRLSEPRSVRCLRACAFHLCHPQVANQAARPLADSPSQ